jgi:GT2 family glycosyltransferase
MKTLIGIGTFGNLPFTQLTINTIRATTKAPVDFFVVVGQPSDVQTSAWLKAQGIPHVVHEANHGFPVALNDMMDAAWTSKIEDRRAKIEWGQYDNLIIVGNDVVPYPGAVDALIEEAWRRADGVRWEWICSSQFDAKSLVARYPEAAEHFTGPNLVFEKWASSRGEVQSMEVVDYTPLVRPWELHQHAAEALVARWMGATEAGKREFVQPDCIKDVRNLCLFKRSVFEKIGYADVNFWPGGYFEDNDYCKRARSAGVKACGLEHSAYFHFWSRTIHQGEGTQPRQFQNNAGFYATKWGGGFDAERYQLPFGGSPYGYCDPEKGISFHHGDGRLKIDSRASEPAIVEYWRGLGAGR